MRVAIASDHGGYRLKEFVKSVVQQLGCDIVDFGTYSEDSVDYPEFAAKVAKAIIEKEVDRGILICGTGIGMSIVANRFPGIRAALCHDVYTARMSRQHNDANILVLGGRVLTPEVAEEIVKVWLSEEFEGGRHERRLGKLQEIEKAICEGRDP
ncbi:ribose 5-phosphate isomerase B [Thermosulfidibacter takaii ABI70S6]|uniref:Ribose 5-phosphate isomerase B n=1 Tax=Thermosulfidibacter takaii (strain DSM 17441 / JCM 13301 / NBRC 103674 / ABI70S6) TaxID=1298851 RepID=A0A0S3QSL3_THET7|nr:ribose 5-phosphate isomerase B [Thermosulfidibacter takaii]BAT71334.1 ribose 5-phosphate isomerase B [Thermosulfidibacter takaii ABI70S6]